MKNVLYASLGFALLLCTVFCSQSANAQANFSFDSTAELTTYFTSANPVYTNSASGGLNSTGAVVNPGIAGDLWALTAGISFTSDVNTYVVRAYFLNATDDGYAGLGFAAGNSNPVGANAEATTGLGMCTHAGGGEFFNDGVSTLTDYGSDLLVNGQWYFVVFTITVTAPNTFNLEYSVTNSDATGGVGSLVVDETLVGVSNATLGGASIIYPYFSGQGSRVSTVDDFSVSVTPLPLPIQLASLTAAPSGGSTVTLTWKTASETDNYGFYVQRSATAKTGFADVSALIPGHGTSTTGFSYRYADKSAPAGTSYYRLKQVDLDNSVHYSDAVMSTATDVAPSVPIVFALSQNYPNPFNPSTDFRFTVAKSGFTTLIVYNVLGQEVATIFNGLTESGQYYTVRLDGTGLASGVYFARLQSGFESQLKKIVLLR